MVAELSWLIHTMVLAIRKEGAVFQGIDGSAAGDAESGKGKGVAAVLYRGTASGGKEFESGGVDKGQMAGIWSEESYCGL